MYCLDNRCSVHPPESDACKSGESTREKFLFRGIVPLQRNRRSPYIVSGKHNRGLDGILIETSRV